MLEIRERSESASASRADLELRLPFEARQRSRSRVRLSSGEEAALLLPRGGVMRGGDVLRLSDGRQVLVVAAPETVSTVLSDDAELLVRAAYHLGNRHVALEVGRGFVRYLHDHVLDDLVRALGLAVRVEEAPFEPEAGAYAHGHSHGHGHGHHAHEPASHAPASHAHEAHVHEPASHAHTPASHVHEPASPAPAPASPAPASHEHDPHVQGSHGHDHGERL